MKRKTIYWILGIIFALMIIGVLFPESEESEPKLTLGEPTYPSQSSLEDDAIPYDNPESEETNNEPEQEDEEPIIPVETTTPDLSRIKIANWNLQIFGNTKASNDELMNSYASVIDDYDIIFIQEIRNKDQTAFPKLCALLPDYDCGVSSRAGRTSSKEQYGIIYKKGIEISMRDFNPDASDRWERPPVEVTFDIEGYELIAYNIHIKPDDAPEEIDYLEDVVETSGNVVVLGDLNADCSYYNPSTETDFDSWEWIIKDSEDTTVSSTHCAYDRILLNDNANAEYSSDGIYTEVTSEQSDHYLVWVELEV